MWLVSLRDLQWRTRRFLIAVVATALAFGLALVMTGVSAHLHNESGRTVDLYDADSWVVVDGASGPFTGIQVLPDSLATELDSRPDVDAAPLLLARANVDGEDVNVVGYVPDSVSEPSALSSLDGGANGAVVDTALGRSTGDELVLGGRTFPVVGTADDVSFYFAMPTVFLPIADVQDTFFAGQAIASTVVVRGDVDSVPAGYATRTSAEVRADLDRVLGETDQTIDVIKILLWIMAAGIVGAMVYVSVLERTRDMAVLKAVGVRTRSLVGGLVLQAVAMALAAVIVSVGIAAAIAPTFSFPVDIPTDAYALLAVLGVVVGSLAALVGVRRVVRTDPALAFGGA
jgi:putative ABC transport system permease protein